MTACGSPIRWLHARTTTTSAFPSRPSWWAPSSDLSSGRAGRGAHGPRRRAGSRSGSIPARTSRSATSYAVIHALIDSARQAKLPTKSDRRSRARGCERRREWRRNHRRRPPVHGATGRPRTCTLGPYATAGELRAAVSAIDARIAPRDLKSDSAGPRPSRRSIDQRCTVLSDIAGRGVPAVIRLRPRRLAARATR